MVDCADGGSHRPESGAEPGRPLAQVLRLGWSRQTAKGFFLRAEDFFSFARRQRDIAREMHETAERFDELEHVRFTRDLLAAPERYWRHL